MRRVGPKPQPDLLLGLLLDLLPDLLSDLLLDLLLAPCRGLLWQRACLSPGWV